MENVLLTFCMVAVVVVDIESTFLKDFEMMCSVLDLHFWPLARGNHKGNGVEKYHRFLNKTATIQGNNHGTHDGVERTVKTSQFAWNSAPIDNTDIPRSIPAV